MLDLRTPPSEFYAKPYPFYTALRETAPVCRMPDGFILLTRYFDLMLITLCIGAANRDPE
jgi:cytochrome P450